MASSFWIVVGTIAAVIAASILIVAWVKNQRDRKKMSAVSKSVPFTSRSAVSPTVMAAIQKSSKDINEFRGNIKEVIDAWMDEAERLLEDASMRTNDMDRLFSVFNQLDLNQLRGDPKRLARIGA